MLSRRARLTVTFSAVYLIAFTVFVVFLALGILGENMVTDVFLASLRSNPFVQKTLEYAQANPPYTLLVLMLASILTALCVDLIQGRTSVDIGLTDTVVKPFYASGDLLFTGLTLFFVNLSRHTTASATASDVTATITLWGRGLINGKIVVHGVWTVTTSVIGVGAASIPARTWSFKPNDEPGKIELCRLSANGKATLFCQETIVYKGDSAVWTVSDKYGIPAGEFLVRVQLRGVGARSRHWVRLLVTDSSLSAEALEWWTALYRWAFVLVRPRN